MKVLWIVNMVLPDLAEHLQIQTGASGTWMIDLSRCLAQREDVELGIACIHGESYQKIALNGITYFVLPGNGKTMLFYNKGIEAYWDRVEREFSPDIIHVHGTEYSHALPYLRRYPEKKKLLTIQGIISKIADKNTGELGLGKLLRYRTLRENLKLNGMLENRSLMRFNSRYEKEIIRSVRYATGRSDWDRFYMQAVNPELTYFRCNYNLREEFYHCPKWDLQKAEKYRIYASTSAKDPLKGGHQILEALSQVKRKFPQVQAVFLAPADENHRLQVTSGYTKYIHKLIERYHLEENVWFISRLDSKGVIEEMLRSHVCVVASAMENASATLRESMHLGVPSVAAYRGGMTQLVRDGENGFFFDFGETEYLAGRIMQIFEDDALAQKLSRNAIEAAAQWHDRSKNVQDMVDTYSVIYEKE